MHHLQPEEALSCFAENAQAYARLVLRHLAGVKIEKAQMQQAAVILQLADQRLARAILGFGVDDLAFDLRMVIQP
jgi:hypothetical protein